MLEGAFGDVLNIDPQFTAFREAFDDSGKMVLGVDMGASSDYLRPMAVGSRSIVTEPVLMSCYDKLATCLLKERSP